MIDQDMLEVHRKRAEALAVLRDEYHAWIISKGLIEDDEDDTP